MKIAYLADHTHFIPTLSRWLFDETHEFFRDKTWKDVAAMFEARLNRGRVPLALVAYEGDEPLGTISLLEESIRTHTHLRPWLAGLHVADEWRHRGVATELISAVVKEAQAMKIETLYAGISKAEDYYERRGWKILDRIIFYDKPLTVIQLAL